MIVGFLGKGGSGKSSVATQMALWRRGVGDTVMAVDADHNMDLSYNLAGGEEPSVPYFGSSLPAFLDAVGLTKAQKYDEAFYRETNARFPLEPLSPTIARYSTVLANGIRLMTAGPQTDTVLYGQACSHSLTTPLKLLLPLLVLHDGEVVVVDEKAGADGVSTGIVTGIDVGVIVCEPALHSIKTAKQIAELMDFYETPYVFVANKVATNEDEAFITNELANTPIAFLKESASVKRNPSAPVFEWRDELQTVFSTAQGLNTNDRYARTVKKFARNREFVHTSS